MLLNQSSLEILSAGQLWTKIDKKLRRIFIIFSLKKKGSVLKKISQGKALSRIFIKKNMAS